MKDKEYPIFTMLVCTVAAWAIVKLATGNDKTASIAAIVTFIYSVYFGWVYTENGKQVMMEQLKEHVIKVVVTIVFLAVSIWLTGVVSSWVGVESVAAKILVWAVLMVVVAIIEIRFVVRKK